MRAVGEIRKPFYTNCVQQQRPVSREAEIVEI
jgi:hypothetical protein